MSTPRHSKDTPLAGDGARFKFTRRSLWAVKPPAKGGRVTVWDTLVRELCVQVLPSGERRFYLYFRLGGRRYRPKLGDYQVMSPEQARAMAREWLGEVARGVNPAQARRTVSPLASEVIERPPAEVARRSAQPERSGTAYRST